MLHGNSAKIAQRGGDPSRVADATAELKAFHIRCLGLVELTRKAKCLAKILEGRRQKPRLANLATH
jgi:hypothetical protein